MTTCTAPASPGWSAAPPCLPYTTWQAAPWEHLAGKPGEQLSAFYDDVEECRGLFARLINASADDIALARRPTPLWMCCATVIVCATLHCSHTWQSGQVPATSYGIATAAANLPLAPGGRVLVEAPAAFQRQAAHDSIDRVEA